MRRRNFFGIVGSTVVGWPSAARAQQADKRPTIGFMGTTTPAAWAPWTANFTRRLRELGWIEGQTVAIEYRWAQSRGDRFTEIAAEFVRLNVDVIVTSGSGAAAARQVTTAIPIVFALAIDPLGGRLVNNLARPGGNLTGLSQQTADLAGKRLELLREVQPSLRRLAILGDPGISQSMVEMAEAERAARSVGVEVVKLEVRRAEDIAPAFETMKASADVLYVCTGPLINTNRVRIAAMAIDIGMPTMCSQRQYIEAGGLLSYGPSITEMFRRAGDYVDKILRGTKPGDIPVEQPTKFELVLNLKTARALGLTISPMLLARADEVIE